MDYKRVLKLHFENGYSGRNIAKNTGDQELAALIGDRSYLSGLPAEDSRNLKIPSLLPPAKPANLPGGGRD